MCRFEKNSLVRISVQKACAKSTSELVMFLTPYIVTTYQEAESVSMPDRQKTDREINAGILEKF